MKPRKALVSDRLFVWLPGFLCCISQRQLFVNHASAYYWFVNLGCLGLSGMSLVVRRGGLATPFGPKQFQVLVPDANWDRPGSLLVLLPGEPSRTQITSSK